MSKTFILVSGWAKSGKDTLASYLAQEKKAKRISFADPLKEEVSKDFGLPIEWLYDQSKKEIPLHSLPVEPKDLFAIKIAEHLYKEFRTWTGQIPESYVFHVDNEFNESKFLGLVDNKFLKLFWTPRALMIAEGSIKRSVDPDFWAKKAIEKAENEKIIVVPDWRYESELQAVRKTLSKEDKLITIRVNRFESTTSQDPSERGLDKYKFDYVIENKGTLQEFLVKINNILKEREI